MKTRMILGFLIGMFSMSHAYALTSCEQTGWCECVIYVRQSGWDNFPQTGGLGEAYRWWDTARSNGYALGNKPMVGAVLVWKGWPKNTAGHVALTASIVSNTEITVNHANWPPSGGTDGKVRLGVKVTDVSGGNWTKVKVNDGGTEYEVYGFIYQKGAVPVDLGPSIRLCAQISGTRQVCWDTKNSVDKRCESGSDWIILDNQTKWRYPTTKAICSSTGCYRSTSVLDFFMRPAYAAAIDGCASQETGTGYGGSGPYPTPADPEEYGSPSSSDLPKLVTAGTSSSAPNLEASVDIEKDKEPDSNAYVRVGDLYCGVRAKNTTSVSIGSFKNKCILYDGKKAGNDPPVTLDSKTVDGLTGGDKETTHHSFTIRDPGYYTLYGCVNTGSSPPKEKSISDNCETKTFQTYSIPDVYVQKLSLQGGVEFLPGSTVTVVADFGNTGDDFHAGKNRRMTVTAELSGCVSSRMMDTTDIDEDVLRHGDNSRTKSFSFTLPLAATGICTATVIADPEGELLQTPNKEANRGNNRMSITFSVVEPTPPPENCDLVISSGGLTGDRTTLKQGDSYGYKARLLNTGSVQCPSDTRLSYFEKGPGDMDWRYIDGDSTPASKLLPGQSSDERMLSDTLVAHVLGSYQGKICADTDNANMEKDEDNNCLLMNFSVVEGPTDPGTQPPPSGTTDPDDDDVIFSIIFD